MLLKIKSDVDRLLLVLTVKEHFPMYFAKIEHFLYFETKSSLSTYEFIFSTISLLKQKFMYFGQKHTIHQCINFFAFKKNLYDLNKYLLGPKMFCLN